MLVVLFALFFVGGPLLFWALTRPVANQRTLQWLGGLMIGCALLGSALRFGVAGRWVQQDQGVMSGVLVMWVAWIGALAFGAQALRRADQGRLMYRATAVLGAIGATVPWFGLATARVMGA